MFFMHRTRVAVPSCRAHNAFDVVKALSLAFSTSAVSGSEVQTDRRQGQQRTGVADDEAIDVNDRLGQDRALSRNEKRSRTWRDPQDHFIYRPLRASSESRSAAAPRGRKKGRSAAAAQGWEEGRSKKGRSAAAPQGREEGRSGLRYKPLVLPPPLSLLTDLQEEWQRAERLATQSHDGRKYMMHWVAKTAHQLSKYGELEWNDPVMAKVRQDLDYPVIAIGPKPSPMETPMALPWALGNQELHRLGPMEVLEEEIARFAVWAQPTAAERAARQAVTKQLQDMISSNLTSVNKDYIKAELFGSEKTGLSTATSDLDIRVYDSSSDDNRGYEKLSDSMQELSAAMDHSRDFKAVSFRHSKYPIIDAQHKASGIGIQIVSSPSTAQQQHWTKIYLAEIPHIRELFFLLRTALAMRGLKDVFDGGIGSYGLFIMLAGSLKRRSSRPPPATAAEGLTRFLEFYTGFMYSKHGLTLEPIPKTFMKRHAQDPRRTNFHTLIRAAYRRNDPVRAAQYAIGRTKALQPYLLCLQDPADPKNDLGRKSNAIKHFWASMKQCKLGLAACLRDLEHGFLGRESVLELLVGRCHEVHASQRAMLEGYGGWVMEQQQQGKAAENSGGAAQAG